MGFLSQLRSEHKVERALRTLHNLGTPVQGPFLTPKRNCIYLVDSCILTESELVGLNKAGHSNPQNIARLLSEFKRLHAS
jgi:hypothetical protein